MLTGILLHKKSSKLKARRREAHNPLQKILHIHSEKYHWKYFQSFKFFQNSWLVLLLIFFKMADSDQLPYLTIQLHRGMQTKLSTFYVNRARRYTSFKETGIKCGIWNIFFQIPKTSITIHHYKTVKSSWYMLLRSVQLSLHPESWALYYIRKTRWQNPPTAIKPNYLTLKLKILHCDCKIKAVLLVFFKEINFILHFTFWLNILCLNEEYKPTTEYLWYSSKTNTVDQGAF